MKILVTGCAGFIGFHLCLKLSKNEKNYIYGIDNLNNYYDIKLKKDRISILKKNKKFLFEKIDISNFNNVKKFFSKKKIDIVIHLAAQAGVRYALQYPEAYINSNLVGFYNIIENSRLSNVKKFYFASSSSVYGAQKKFPTKEEYSTDNPESLYAATKKNNEIVAQSYFNTYKFKSTALRFFTVYGPYGRPDMALFIFTKSIFEGKKIQLYNSGNHVRDFTYISDVVTSIEKIIKKKQIGSDIFNISSSNPQKLLYFIKVIEKTIGKKAKRINKKMQTGDVLKTHGNSHKLHKFIGFIPTVKIEEGISKFINWYKDYYKFNENK